MWISENNASCKKKKNQNHQKCLNSDISSDVGRSCILLTIGGKNLMLDCGMHMGYNDEVSIGYIQFVSWTSYYGPVWASTFDDRWKVITGRL